MNGNPLRDCCRCPDGPAPALAHMVDPLAVALSSLQMAETAAKTLVRGASSAEIAELRSTASGIVEALIDVRVAIDEAVAERQTLVSRIEDLETLSETIVRKK